MATVRKAHTGDAPRMGEVHVRAWQAAYRGQMPDAYLDGLQGGERAAMWERALAREREEAPILVAEQDGAVVGFATVGAAQEPSGFGELYAINVDPAHWGTGAGAALLGAAQEALAGLGYAEAVLWVLPGNRRARRFYERARWTADGAERTFDVLGVTVPEVRYRRAF